MSTARSKISNEQIASFGIFLCEKTKNPVPPSVRSAPTENQTSGFVPTLWPENIGKLLSCQPPPPPVVQAVMQKLRRRCPTSFKYVHVCLTLLPYTVAHEVPKRAACVCVCWYRGCHYMNALARASVPCPGVYATSLPDPPPTGSTLGLLLHLSSKVGSKFVFSCFSIFVHVCFVGGPPIFLCKR